MKNIWLPAFVLVALAHLAAAALENKSLIFITKPLLMPLLAVWLAAETRKQPPRFLTKMTFAALVFATLGDVLLMWGEQPLFFMLGLATFLFAHLSYIGGFTSISNLEKGALRRQPWRALPFVAFFAGFLWHLWPGIPADMKLPVSIYAAVITLMALSVMNLGGSISAKTYWTLLFGALLFMLSDSLLAENKFGSPLPNSRVAIMATYLAGQFLIVKGVRDTLTVRHF